LSHDGQIYINPGGTAAHLHRLGNAPCTDCNCAYREDGMPELLAQHEDELRDILATDKYCCTLYDVDWDCWRPDWIEVDEDGQVCWSQRWYDCAPPLPEQGDA
jgi:hypothetical protein